MKQVVALGFGVSRVSILSVLRRGRRGGCQTAGGRGRGRDGGGEWGGEGATCWAVGEAGWAVSVGGCPPEKKRRILVLLWRRWMAVAKAAVLVPDLEEKQANFN